MIDARLPVRITLDDAADAAYIYLVDEVARGGVARTVTLGYSDAMINVDFDSSGRVIGVEIVGADATLPAQLLSRLRGS